MILRFCVSAFKGLFGHLRGSITIAALLVLSGCAGSTAPVLIHSADSMYITNPMKKIAVFSSAYVVWPRTGIKQQVLDIRVSKQSQEKLLPLIQAQLVRKGYEVASLNPTGVAFVTPDIKYKDFYVVDGDSEERKVESMAPVFVYPVIKQNPDLEKAIRDFIEPLNYARKARRLSSFAPDRDAIKVIARELGAGADTLCHMYVIGDKFSTTRKVGVMLLGPYSGGMINDDLFVELTCVQVEGSQVLWITSHVDFVDPMEPTATFTEVLTQNLPQRGTPLDKGVRKVENRGN